MGAKHQDPIKATFHAASFKTDFPGLEPRAKKVSLGLEKSAGNSTFLRHFLQPRKWRKMGMKTFHAFELSGKIVDERANPCFKLNLKGMPRTTDSSHPPPIGLWLFSQARPDLGLKKLKTPSREIDRLSGCSRSGRVKRTRQDPSSLFPTSRNLNVENSRATDGTGRALETT
ncbi:unnamed protein product, partial [Nesidiocoris tenuis]